MGEPYYSVRLGRGTGPLHPRPASGRMGVLWVEDDRRYEIPLDAHPPPLSVVALAWRRASILAVVAADSGVDPSRHSTAFSTRAFASSPEFLRVIGRRNTQSRLTPTGFP